MFSFAAIAALFAAFYGVHLAASGPADAAHGTSPTLDAIARSISGRPDVTVRCAPTGVPGVLGMVAFYGESPAAETVLAPEICETLTRFGQAPDQPSLECTRLGGGACPQDVLELAWAVSALAHESYHLSGVRDEAATTCYGLQATGTVASSLGASPAYAQRLEDYVFWNVRPPVDAGYFSPECRDGGRLDLRTSDPRWP
jgi:hypothetical protein